MITFFDGKKATPKQKAQEELLSALQTGFYKDFTADGMTESQALEVTKHMSKQMARIEKLFGYEPNTWIRG